MLYMCVTSPRYCRLLNQPDLRMPVLTMRLQLTERCKDHASHIDSLMQYILDAGVGVGGITMVLFVIVFNFLLFVTTPLVARAVARRDAAEVCCAYSSCYIVSSDPKQHMSLPMKLASCMCVCRLRKLQRAAFS